MQLSKLNPTAVVMTILTLAFIWAQWPTKTTTKIPDQLFMQTDEKIGYKIQFEQEPELETISVDGQTIQLYVASRKGLDFMLQIIEPGADNQINWLEASKKMDVANFNGSIELDWQFKRQNNSIFEYVISNNLGYANQVRVIFTPKAIYKLAVGFKQKNDPELLTRILTYLDSFTLLEN